LNDGSALESSFSVSPSSDSISTIVCMRYGSVFVFTGTG
jgi:hypothetical protein